MWEVEVLVILEVRKMREITGDIVRCRKCETIFEADSNTPSTTSCPKCGGILELVTGEKLVGERRNPVDELTMKIKGLAQATEDAVELLKELEELI
jgi:transcription initiation factor IIE alpha subunit